MGSKTLVLLSMAMAILGMAMVTAADDDNNFRYALSGQQHVIVGAGDDSGKLTPPKKKPTNSINQVGPISTGPSFFEVSAPLNLPDTSKLLCKSPLLTYTFGDTSSNTAPVKSSYTACTTDYFDKVVLKFNGSCSGRQFGRLATLWLGSVEILRTVTPEFTDSGGAWSFTKDVTRYTSVFKKSRSVFMALGNVLDVLYNGYYTISVTVEFYDTGVKRVYASPDLSAAPSHVIKSVSLANPADGGYWYRIGGDSGTKATKTVTGLPQNAYRAVLEICVSFHGDDESWYTNPPDSYSQANNLTFGNGPFREVAAYIDGKFVGAVWPFQLIYSGGFNPLAWRPAMPIGTTVIPTYDLDITPFLSMLIDGKDHQVSITVDLAQSSWLVDCNLHFWVDSKADTTTATLLSYYAPSYAVVDKSTFKGLDGNIAVTATRNYSFSGTVTSSSGTITTCVSSLLYFNTSMLLADSYGYQSADLLIQSQTRVQTADGGSITGSYVSSYQFPLDVVCTQAADNIDPNSTILSCNVDHAFNTDEFAVFPKGSLLRQLKNSQITSGGFTINQDNTVSGGNGKLQQVYDLKGTAGCYSRSLATNDSSIVSDTSSSSCSACSTPLSI